MFKKRYKKRRLLQTTGIKSFSTVQSDCGARQGVDELWRIGYGELQGHGQEQHIAFSPQAAICITYDISLTKPPQRGTADLVLPSGLGTLETQHNRDSPGRDTCASNLRDGGGYLG